MTFNRFHYIGLEQSLAYGHAQYSGYQLIVIKRPEDIGYYEGSSVSNMFNDRRITLLVDNSSIVTDCYIG